MASRFHLPDTAETTCTLNYIQAELGQRALSPRRLLAYVGDLIAHHGFPPPLPSPLRGGGITGAVQRRSAWIKSAVDAWLAGFIPPDCGITIDRAAQAAAAADMDQAAKSLRVVGGRDYAGGAA